MSDQTKEFRFLIDLIQESYSKKAWHGANLRGSIRGVSEREASWRPGPRRHNIWEIVVHCAYWKYIIRRRILGERRGSFPLKGSNWFVRPHHSDARSWKQDLALLRDCHESMVQTILTLAPNDLKKAPRGSVVSNETIFRGIASHDVYHTGQIQIIKRLMRS